jgi:SAM-dependent methyltransferase
VSRPISDVEQHLRYVNDDVRTEAYRRALARTIRKGDRVLDLGAGTGILGFLALEAGAGHVYSVDWSGMVALGREVATANRYTNITFLQAHSVSVILPELVDVVVCDQLGPLAVHSGLLNFLHDAAQRHLRPGGRLIPEAIELELMPIHDDTTRQLIDAWSEPLAGVDFSRARQWAANTVYARMVSASQGLGTPCRGSRIETGLPVEGPIAVAGRSTVTAANGRVDAIAASWISHLAPSVTLSNSPTRTDAIDRPLQILPLEHALDVVAGDILELSLSTNPNTAAVTWRVQQRRAPAHNVVADERHSTMLGDLMTAEDLARNEPGWVPELGPLSVVSRSVLNWADGTHTLEEIEMLCIRAFGDRFSSDERARMFVRAVLEDARH